MSKPTFRPAPRPRASAATDEAAHLLADATRDLGFGRASTAPSREDRPAERASVQGGKSPLAPTRKATVKLDVPEEVYTALRREALERRVTVKFLILEALAAKGYAIDLANVPEDGRRNR